MLSVVPGYISDTWQSLLGFTEVNIDRLLGDDVDTSPESAGLRQRQQSSAAGQHQHREEDDDDQHRTLLSLTYHVGGKLRRRVVSVTLTGREKVIEALPESLHARERLHFVEEKAGAALSKIQGAKDAGLQKAQAVRNKIHGAKDLGLQKIHDVKDAGIHRIHSLHGDAVHAKQQVVDQAKAALAKAKGLKEEAPGVAYQTAERLLDAVRARVPAALAPPTMPQIQTGVEQVRKELPPRVSRVARCSVTLGRSGFQYALSRRVFHLPTDGLEYLGHAYRSVRSPDKEWRRCAKFQRLDNEVTDLALAIRDLFVWSNPVQQQKETQEQKEDDNEEQDAHLSLPSYEDLFQAGEQDQQSFQSEAEVEGTAATASLGAAAPPATADTIDQPDKQSEAASKKGGKSKNKKKN